MLKRHDPEFRGKIENAPGSLLRAIKYVWCIESFWWIQPSLESSSVVPVRFAEEMIHNAERWEQLDALLGGIQLEVPMFPKQ